MALWREEKRGSCPHQRKVVRPHRRKVSLCEPGREYSPGTKPATPGSWTSSLQKGERVFCYSSTSNLRQSVFLQMSLFKCLKNIVWVILIIAEISSLVHIKQNVNFENLYSKFFVKYMKKMTTKNVVDLSK